MWWWRDWSHTQRNLLFHWHAIQLSLSPVVSLHPTVDELAGVCLFVCKQTSACLFSYIHKCAYHCLMYPAAIHIFVSVAWLMVCCRYDSPLPRPPHHCCPSGCCGGGTFLPLATKKPKPPSRLLMLRWRLLGRILDSVTVSPFVDIFVEFDRSNQKQLQIASWWWDE